MSNKVGYFCVPALLLALLVILTALSAFVVTINAQRAEHITPSMPEARGGEYSSTRVCVDGFWYVVENEKLKPVLIGSSMVPCKSLDD